LTSVELIDHAVNSLMNIATDSNTSVRTEVRHGQPSGGGPNAKARLLGLNSPNEKARDPATVGQPRLPHIEIHPVNGLHLEHHMLVEHISDTARYGHQGSGRTGGQLAHQPLRRFIYRTGTPVTV
jgi:hypothetical protein